MPLISHTFRLRFDSILFLRLDEWTNDDDDEKKNGQLKSKSTQSNMYTFMTKSMAAAAPAAQKFNFSHRDKETKKKKMEKG